MNTRWPLSILALSTTVLASAVIPIGAQPPPGAIRGPAHGDGGVSDFYAWKEKVPRVPGTLLRQEPLPDQLMLTNAAKGLRVLYTSTDGIDGKSPIAVSGAIYLPKGTPPVGGWPIVAWAHGNDGHRRCVRTLVDGAWDARYGLSECLAGAGLCGRRVRLPGPGHSRRPSWMAVRPEGWSVLDSVRSALRAFPQLANAVVIVGQSQGSHAALSATGLAPRYAPALRIKGTVATGVAGPLYAASRRTTALLFLLLHKFQAMDPAFRPSDYLTEAGERGYAAAASTCVRPGPAVPLDPLLKAWPDHAKVPAVEDWPTLHFTHPLFIGTGLADTAGLPAVQYATAAAACRAGAIVEMHYYPGQDHGGAVNASLVDSLPFVAKLFAGQPVAGNCGTLKPPPTN